MLDIDTWEPQMVLFSYGKTKWEVVDPAFKSEWEKFESFQPGSQVSIAGITADKKTLVLRYSSCNTTAAYYLYRKGQWPPVLLLEDRPDLKPYRMAQVHIVLITARDGLKLPSYLTLPVLPGVPSALPESVTGPVPPEVTGMKPSSITTEAASTPLHLNLPMVLLVHGGPWARDYWALNPQVQMLANRGYAVLQVNFRGSSGFGKNFTNAGNGQWGVGAMQHDLTDAANWAVAKGIADPKAICIMGELLDMSCDMTTACCMLTDGCLHAFCRLLGRMHVQQTAAVQLQAGTGAQCCGIDGALVSAQAPVAVFPSYCVPPADQSRVQAQLSQFIALTFVQLLQHVLSSRRCLLCSCCNGVLTATAAAAKHAVSAAGSSYGGYATLAGLAFTPDLYRCGVDIVGISNVATVLKSMPPYWSPIRYRFFKRIGDAINNQTLNKQISPLYHADKIRAPLLIGQGANDPRVRKVEADQIYTAVRTHNPGMDVQYVLYPDEGHGFVRPDNKLDFASRVEVFLAQHLGGRNEPALKVPGSTAQLISKV